MQKRVDTDDMSSEAEKDVKTITKNMVDVRCGVEEVHVMVPKDWRDDIDHDCLSIKDRVVIIK